jgi:hypothetical protein
MRILLQGRSIERPYERKKLNSIVNFEGQARKRQRTISAVQVS